jgi:dTDP-4-amino-4,6-dideoxygalactose transaminase
MKVQRTVPPTAAFLKWIDLFNGFGGLLGRGSYMERLEAELKQTFNVPYVFCVSSGKAALTLILLALGHLSKKTEVICPAYTCFSVPASIRKAGLKIVPCDVDTATFDFDYGSLKKKLTNQTLCVIATHLFGIPADLDRLRILCAERGVFLVEDAAQAMGGGHNGQRLGTIGDVGFYSLDRGKNITCGSGGIIVTRDCRIATGLAEEYKYLEQPRLTDDLTNLLQLCLMSVLIHPWLYWIPAGMRFLKLGQTFFPREFPIRKLSSRRAALLRHWRDRLDASTRARAEAGTCFFKNLPWSHGERKYIAYLRLPMLVNNRKTRDEIYKRSKEWGLGLSLMYPTAVHEIEEIKCMFHREEFPGARKIAETLVMLPTHHLLSEGDKNRIRKLFTDVAPEIVLTGSRSASETV